MLTQSQPTRAAAITAALAPNNELEASGRSPRRCVSEIVGKCTGSTDWASCFASDNMIAKKLK